MTENKRSDNSGDQGLPEEEWAQGRWQGRISNYQSIVAAGCSIKIFLIFLSLNILFMLVFLSINLF
jgi:hypothetical protein